MKTKRITLDEFRKAELRLYPNATGELSNLLQEIGLAAKRIHAVVSMSHDQESKAENFGINVSGEVIKELDRFANEELLRVLKGSFSCAGVASEEENDILIFDNASNNKSQYVVMFDPLDGSSNSNNCMTIGTVFGIYRRKTEHGSPCIMEDFLQQGRKMAAAGYVIYGSSTMMIYATRRGVNGFTLDPSIGEFCLTHPGIICPSAGKIYSINESNILRFNQAVKEYIRSIQRQNLVLPGSFSARYVGSMVADLHRTLLEGGIFMYPGTENDVGKLRLMYECNPFAFIFEIAGGLAVDGYRNILDIVPDTVHQRTPFFTGSSEMIQELNRLLRYHNRVGMRYDIFRHD